MRVRSLFVAMGAALLLVGSLFDGADAHLGNISYADFAVRENQVLLKFRYAAHITPGFPADQTTPLTRAQILNLEGGIAQWLGRTVDIQSGGKHCELSIDNLIGPDRNDDLELLAVWTCDVKAIEGVRMDFRALQSVADEWQTIATMRFGGQTLSTVFVPSTTRWIVGNAGPLAGAADSLAGAADSVDDAADSLDDAAVSIDDANSSQGVASTGSAFHRFFLLGVKHIWSGYDHLLFLLAVLLAGGGLMRLAGIVTSFTLAHSITLGAAATGWLHFPPAHVEVLIALSIVYVAMENILGRGADRRAAVTFGFGLIHGFGFAGVLAEAALPASGILVPLLAFNLGVEGGQLVVVALLVPALALLLRGAYAARIRTVLSVLIALAGVAWAVERIALIMSRSA